jgi:carbon-monoxide dehydrogenase iron sulfur subunit
MRIKINRKQCTGCHLCELICSLFHLGVMNTEKSAIRIYKDDLDTGMSRPLVCRQCKEMKCLEGEDAVAASEKKRFVWNRERAERCPFHGLGTYGDYAYHCDLCGGKPQCVKVCTSGAIRTYHSGQRINLDF